MTVNERGPTDLIYALALIHHISISNNVPFDHVAQYFQNSGKHLIIEFVPKSDSQVKILLTTREDIITQYNQEVFEKLFGYYFYILQSNPVKSSDRTLYLMKSKDN